jgi:hypothetical protein
MRRVLGLVLLLGFGLLVFFITREAYRPDQPIEQVNSTVLLERVRPVLKLVTVEGEFSELYTYRSADAAFEWLEQFPIFQKQAILRVKGRASVGYDLEGLGLEFDDATHTVRLSSMGRPQLLALEHDVDYFDMQEGTFNDFTATDHTRINAQSKELIRRQVEKSGLYEAAEAQRSEMLHVLRAMVENAGWRFEDDVTPVDGRTRLKG